MDSAASNPIGVVLVVDVANVMGSRPDGWWRDRAGAAQRLLSALSSIAGQDVAAPEAGRVRLERVVAVLEGQARQAADPEGSSALEVVRATRDGDSAIVDVAHREGARALVVTADRGLRQRLAPQARTAGPQWLLGLLP